jgi:hypothetical protein
MKRRLSSLQTVLQKVILPAIWIPLFGIVTLSMVFGSTGSHSASPNWLFVLIWIVGSAFIVWGSVRLKEVSVDDDYLYVSNYLKEIAIPLSDIFDVTENRLLNYRPVTIHLKSPSEFGDKIVFMPTVRFFAGFSSHPVVAELKDLARPRIKAGRFR